VRYFLAESPNTLSSDRQAFSWRVATDEITWVGAALSHFSSLTRVVRMTHELIDSRSPPGKRRPSCVREVIETGAGRRQRDVEFRAPAADARSLNQVLARGRSRDPRPGMVDWSTIGAIQDVTERRTRGRGTSGQIRSSSHTWPGVTSLGSIDGVDRARSQPSRCRASSRTPAPVCGCWPPILQMSTARAKPGAAPRFAMATVRSDVITRLRATLLPGRAPADGIRWI